MTPILKLLLTAEKLHMNTQALLAVGYNDYFRQTKVYKLLYTITTN